MKEFFIVGSGGFSKQVIEIIERINEVRNEYKLVGLIDDNKELIGKKVLGYKVVGTTDYLLERSMKKDVYAVIAIANGMHRKKIFSKLPHVRWTNLIHPSTVISKYTKMGKGNIICAGVVINPECEIGDFCQLNIGNTVGHDVFFRNYVTVMPGCRISGNVLLKDFSTIGTGSVILQGKTVETEVILGAGAVLTKNTEKENVYIGVPAEKIVK